MCGYKRISRKGHNSGTLWPGLTEIMSCMYMYTQIIKSYEFKEIAMKSKKNMKLVTFYIVI